MLDSDGIVSSTVGEQRNTRRIIGMKIRRWILVIGAVSLSALGGVAFGQDQTPSGEMNKGLAPEVQQKMELTDAQVKGFFDAADELRAAGKDADAANDTSKT